jgi:hypothetical protein
VLDTNRTRDKLVAIYDRLNPAEQALLQLLSVIYEPAAKGMLLRCVQSTPIEPFQELKGKLRVPDDLVPVLKRLRSLQLIDTQLQCQPVIVEVVARRAVAAGHFLAMAKAVRQVVPAEAYMRANIPGLCGRRVRELRIALYTRDGPLFNMYYSMVLDLCPASFTVPDPVARVCNNPFDPAWMAQMPLEWQFFALCCIFQDATWHLGQDNEALAYALNKDFLQQVPLPSGNGFFYHLITRLLVNGRLAEARTLLIEVQRHENVPGLPGLLAFLEGRQDHAEELFAADLLDLRRTTRKRNAYFFDMPGVAYLLALLQGQNPARLATILRYLGQTLSREQDAPALKSAYKALSAVVQAQLGEVDQARNILDTATGQTPWALFFQAMAAFCVNAELSPETIDALSDIFIKAREVGQRWLAMECAELLCRAEQETPLRRHYIQQVQQDTGMASYVAGIPIEEPWRRRLRALLDTAAGVPDEPASAAARTRLIWLVSYTEGQLLIQPKIQKLSAKGTWTEGRPVALSRLYSGTDLECLSEQDQTIRASLERRISGYYGVHYEFNMNRTLPALVGHPLLFLESAPRVPIEFVRGEPEIQVTQTDNVILIKFSLSGVEGPITVVQETPTRFRVVELTERHRRIARIIGNPGLAVPASAKQDVLTAIAGLSSRVTVHSAIGGQAKDILETPADPIPWAHLLPAGTGFRLELFVKPLGDYGPHLKPGSGMQNIIADVGGTRMQTHRDLALEAANSDAVESLCVTAVAVAEGERQWYLQDPEDCLQLLLNLKMLQDRGEVRVAWPEGEKLRVTREVSFEHLRLKIRGRADWFEVSGQLQLDDGLTLDMKQLLDLLHQNRTRFVPIGEGQFLALTRDLRKRLEELEIYTETRGDRVRLHPLAALALKDFTSQLTNLDADPAWHKRLQTIAEGLERTPAVPSTLKATLRDYQVEGYQWLARLAHLGIGACLADDMGLGKTLQALAIIVQRAPGGPTLVVAPTSVCMNWLSEAHRFAPTLNVIQFGGNGRETLVRDLGRMDVLVCSFGLLQQEAELLASVEWHTIVLDEAQAIKNITTKRARAAMTLKGAFKLITTGTPIENHLGELYTLFHFINSGLLGSRDRFNERFAIPIERYADHSAKKRLKRLIQPFILRRTKAQVLDELPPRTEVMLQVELSPEEAAFYEALRRTALERLELDSAPAGQKHLKILAEIMRLRRACCHPRLVMADTALPSAKLELFGEVVSELLENGHKALVFSQFVTYLALIREYLDSRKIAYRYLDGATPTKDRKKEVEAFQTGSGDLFLISLKAGGLGLNLTAADYVIHMDPWWNPAVEDQASDRAHRIGQQRPVTVYRLVTQHTIEEKIVQLHQDKRDLASSLLDGSDISGRISADELLQLLRES